MISLAQTILRRVVPPALREQARHTIDRIKLGRLERATFDTRQLRAIGAGDLAQIFNDATIAAAWATDQARIKDVMPPVNLGDGVNPGDRRALYYLVAHCKPAAILEVGTHIAASTLTMAQAQATHVSGGARLTTVDITDVNDPKTGAYAKVGVQRPADAVAKLGLGDRVTFLVRPALEFLRQSSERFDMILLDGDHRASAVYEELAAALSALNPNGIVVLHDYYPDMQSIAGERAIPGPYLGGRRACTEVPDLQILPLGQLPWPTKAGSQTTTLAIATRRR